MQIRSYTPYNDVDAILEVLLADSKAILKDQFVGIYLFGSLANGDFDTASDVDVLIVTKNDIAEAIFSGLHSMHERIAILDSPWASQLEVSYIPKSALRRYNPASNIHPHLDRGRGEKLHMMLHASDWVIQRHILYERGVTVEGPDSHTLIDPVPSNDLKWAVVDVLPLWAEPLLKDPAQEIRPRGYQSYIVLSLCRMLYTVQNGAVFSKIAAAKWALNTLDRKWQPLIERAIVGRQNAGSEVKPEDVSGTLDFIHYAMEQCRLFEKSNNLPTRYPDVNKVLNLLHSSVKDVLGNQFVGMYLYGSLSSGDFNPETSDIDFLVVTTDSLSDKTISELEAMHNRTWAAGLKRAGKLEGAYVPRELIRRHDPNAAPCPTINEGKFYTDCLGSDWVIQRHVIREYGVVLEGPDPKTLIDLVTPDDIREAVLGVLQEWWFPMLANPSWLREHENGDRAFAVITMCRVLHALEHGTIVSKPKAIQWARSTLDGSWIPLIDKALAASEHKEQGDLLDETLGFIRFTMEHVNNNYA